MEFLPTLFPSFARSAPHLCAQGTKLPSPRCPQFPWASPAEFTTWKQASGAGREPEEAWAGLGGSPDSTRLLLPQYPPPRPRPAAPTFPRAESCIHPRMPQSARVGGLTRPPELPALLLKRGTCSIPAVAAATGTRRTVQ